MFSNNIIFYDTVQYFKNVKLLVHNFYEDLSE